MSSLPNSDELAQIIRENWSTVLDTDESSFIIESAPPEDNSDNFITGCISIAGDNKLAIFVDCSRRLVERTASILFEHENPTNEEINDALAELSNILGGMILYGLEGKNNLGLPIVTKGRKNFLQIPRSQILSDVHMCFEGLHFAVTIVGMQKK